VTYLELKIGSDVYLNKVYKVEQHSFYCFKHLAVQQSNNDPIGVPVVNL